MYEKTSKIINIAQARAKYAWECAKKRKGNKDYASIVSKLPSYIKTNGLLNTLAFLYSKDKYNAIFEDIEKSLVDKEIGSIKGLSDNVTNDKFMDYLVNKASAQDLIQYTTDVLALLNWLRRFVEDTEAGTQ